MAFIIQSAEHSPIYLEAQLISFLDTFYHEIFTVEEFETYKQGVIDRKLQGFKCLEDEAQNRYNRIRHFKHEAGAYIEWNRREKEI